MDKWNRIFLIVVYFSIVAWIITVFSEGSESVQFKIFFLGCGDFFADFLNICGYSAAQDVYNNEVNGLVQKLYPPLPYVLANVFSHLDAGENPSYLGLYTQPRFLIIYLLFVFFILLCIYVLISDKLQGSGLQKFLLSLPIVFSGAMLFTIERGNVILLAFLFILMYWFWYDSRERFIRECALLALGGAIAFKVSPIVLTLSLVYERRFVDLGKVVTYSLVLFFIPFFYFKGGLDNFALMLRNMNEFFVLYGTMPNMSMISSSTLVLQEALGWEPMDVKDWMSLFRFVCLGSAVIIAASAWRMERKWERCLAISLPLLIVPSVSHSYCALYFIPALVFFLNERKREYLDILCLIGFVLICWVYILPLDGMDYLTQCQLALWFFYIFIMIKSAQVINLLLKRVGEYRIGI